MSIRIPFNASPVMETSLPYIKHAIESRVSGDGDYTKKCSDWMETHLHAPKIFLTTSGSHALDMAARLCGVGPGDEVIMASYTFSSTANAFVGLGARIVFVDIRPDTMNINELLIEGAITEKTKVIVPMHYAGVSCDMDIILKIAQKYNLFVVEDAAQGVMSFYRNRALGTLAHLGCYSFHETKNYSMGEGGALVVNTPNFLENAEIMREKGTDRSRFFRGQVDKYSWVEWGSSYLPSEMNAAYLWSQLEQAEEINQSRLAIWNYYHDALLPLEERGVVSLPVIPRNCVHNAHMFYVKVQDISERTALIDWLREGGIGAVYHYVPLHSSVAGLKYGYFYGEDRFTTRESERLLRLPLYYGLTLAHVKEIAARVKAFFDR